MCFRENVYRRAKWRVWWRFSFILASGPIDSFHGDVKQKGDRDKSVNSHFWCSGSERRKMLRTPATHWCAPVSPSHLFELTEAPLQIKLSSATCWMRVVLLFQSPSAALQDGEDGLGSPRHAGYSSGNVRLRVRTRFLLFLSSASLHERLSAPPSGCSCRYVGEIIRDTEADKRENDSFLFTLDNKVSFSVRMCNLQTGRSENQQSLDLKFYCLQSLETGNTFVDLLRMPPKFYSFSPSTWCDWSSVCWCFWCLGEH